MSDYVVYKKKPCKCTTPGYFPNEVSSLSCAYCKGSKKILIEVDLKKAIIDILEKDSMWLRYFTQEISYA